MARTPRARPVDIAPSPWPDRPTKDPLGEYARRWVLRLLEVIDDRSIRSVADAAGLHHATLDAIVAGRVWPDLATIRKLELSTGTVIHAQLGGPGGSGSVSGSRRRVVSFGR